MKIVPHAWKDKPALIEVAFPAQKISIESQCERKANAGQTLTALGSYWKGRKPLVLVRACVLGALLPSTGNTEEDLEVFEMLMAMDDDAFIHRLKNVDAKDVETWAGSLRDEILDEAGKWKVRGDEKQRLLARVLMRMPYDRRLDKRSRRPEELPETAYAEIWDKVNLHLRTTARSHTELVEQLGMLRFGHRTRVADPFCGGGSIPFEAARVGCDVYASDVSPIACMLTWGAFHVINADAAMQRKIRSAQEKVAAAVDAEITRLGIEHDGAGNRAKAYLYCLEVTCPETGYRVPLAPSWVISVRQRCVAKLIALPDEKRFRIDIISDVSDAEMIAARAGTVQQGDVVYVVDGREYRTPIKTLRGDRRIGRDVENSLRRWTCEDFMPRHDDIFGERLYCIQWMRGEGGHDTFFRSATEDDAKRETRVEELVRSHLHAWQAAGHVPDMIIEPGDKTDEPIRTRGWTHWHHLFNPRQLHQLALYKAESKKVEDPVVQAALVLIMAKSSEWNARLCRWDASDRAKRESRAANVFFNQALNTLYNYAARGFTYLANHTLEEFGHLAAVGRAVVETRPAASVATTADIFITDPPYADAVRYEEITEFFIAWIRKNPPAPFGGWVWDSRRDLAIRGSGEDFRVEMVKAYTALANHMPDNGMQIVMFTHQDAKVWGDMAGIFWAAGLRVTAAWYIATETTSELKKGGYVQGTVILVLRKRTETKKAYKDELVLEVREEVKKQLETMVGLNQQVRARGRSENLFEDADLQMAGYAAALRVLTGYTAIDGIDMTREALRPRTEGERTIVDELIEFAVAIANEELVPDGLAPKVWEKLVGVERFYLRMLDLEAAGLKKLDNYQNFAKAFRVGDWQPLMGSMKPNDAKLKSAREFKRAEFGDTEFGSSLLRAVLYALYELEAELETDEVMSHLCDNITGYYSRRADIVAVASYLAGKLERLRDDEAGAARVLRDLVKGERLGA